MNQADTVELEEANLKNKKAFYELMIRDGWFLAKLSSKFINAKIMQMIRSKDIYAITQ